ncbi:MAG: metal ABC transporter ATP-binding protein [Candidatus Brocadiia bacterium]
MTTQHSPQPPPVLIQGLTFSYDGTPALEDVQLRVDEHSFACVVGPNGGGKTTLLKLILGLLHPQRGTVRVFGQPPQRVRSRLGYVPQHAHYDRLFPVRLLDVVLMGRLGPGHWLGGYGPEDREAARRALAEVELEGLEGRPFAVLSGGQQQRALIARALATEPDLLVLDEPTANLDAAVEQELYCLLGTLRRRLTILLATHDLGFVASYVDTVVCVKRQVVVHPTSELTGETLAEIYGEGARAIRHDHRCAEGGHQWPPS